MQNTDSSLLVWTEQGLFSPQGGFYIDPLRPVSHAIITHAHSDHARKGSKLYTCVDVGSDLLRTRLGQSIQVQGIPYKHEMNFNDIKVSFHSAGHILGSAQVRIQKGSEVWVVSGDYKREKDPSCDPFEVVPCDTFVSEATFGTPQYRWSKSVQYGKEIFDWWRGNAKQGNTSVIFAYSLGKAQRVLAELYPYADRPIWIHESVSVLTQCYRNSGKLLAPTRDLTFDLKSFACSEELVIVPPGSIAGKLLSQVKKVRTAFVSGWMQSGNIHRDRFFDHGFVMSDHADWDDLNRTIEETGAKRVFLLHRKNGALARHLKKKGIDAHHVSSLALKNLEQFFQLSLFNTY